MNLYNVLSNRYVGMSNFERLFAQKFGVTGGEIKELEGAPPFMFTANGQPLLDYLISGNTVQSGTPTPDNPIMPIGCGERTENLLDLSLNNWEQGIINTGGGRTNTDYAIRTIGKIKVEPNTTYTLKNWDTSKFHIAYHQWESDEAYVSDSGWQLKSTIVFTTSPKTTLIEFTVRSAKFSVIHPSDIADSSAFSFVLGDVPPDHYIPYGYKLPLTSAGQGVDIYLGEVQTTRRIKKLVLTGEEDWHKSSVYIGSASVYLRDIAPNAVPFSPIVCTHLGNKTLPYQYGNGRIDENSLSLWLFNKSVTITDFKSYLAAQYAAGTPVTVWYVLAEPETGILNEPIRKIGDYADTVSMEQAGVSIPTSKGSTTLDVDTTIKPSNVYIKYHT